APVVLCHLEGLSQDEVAQHLRVTQGQLRGRLYRGRARLRERLLRRGFALAAVLLALSVAREARAVPPALAACTSRLAGATPDTIPVAVRLLTTAVIEEMTPTLPYRALLALVAVLGIVAAGFSICASAADRARPQTAPVAVVEQSAPAPAKPQEVADKADDPPPLSAKERFQFEGSHAALSADGKTVATWGRKSIVLWSTATGKEIGKLEHQGGNYSVKAAAFSPDGKSLAAAAMHELDA